MNWVHGAIIVLVVAAAGAGGYIMLDTETGEMEDRMETEDPVTGDVTRHAPDIVDSGTTMLVTLELNTSRPKTVTVHERINHDTTMWHNVTVRDADAETVRYDISIPEDIDAETVTVSGQISPDGIDPAEDTTVTVREDDTAGYWEPDYVQLLPATGAGYNWEEIHHLDTGELSDDAVSGVEAVYESPYERVTVAVTTFESVDTAESYLDTIHDQDDAIKEDGYVTFDRDGKTFRAWTVENLYIEAYEDEDLIEIVQNSIMEERGMPLD